MNLNFFEVRQRIDSPVHRNNKPLLNIDLLQVRNSAYKPAYKQKRKITQISVFSSRRIALTTEPKPLRIEIFLENT
jgi:hypothetical protein